MQLNGKRSYGKIASLPPEVRNAVDNMILTCTVRLPEIQAYIEEQAGVDVSTSTISRYGKRLSETPLLRKILRHCARNWKNIRNRTARRSSPASPAIK